MRVDVLEVANYGAYIESENCAASLRQVNNCSRTFQVFGDGFEKVAPVDLNSPLLPEPFPVISASQSLNDGTNEMTCESNKLSTMTTFDCKRMWLNRDSRSRRSASIWRPRPLQGYASLGDCLIVGSSPPASGILVVEASDDTVAPPTSFARAGAIHDAHGNVLGVWSPVPPREYVSCGDVLTRDILQAPPLTACVCVREDLASTVSRSGACTDPTQVTFDGIFVEDALWASREGHESAARELGSRRAARTFATVGIVPVFKIRRKSSWTVSSSSVRSRLCQVASNSRQGGGTEHFTQRFRSARESRAVGERGVFSSTPVRESDRYLVRHERNIGAHGRKHHDDSGGVVL